MCGGALNKHVAPYSLRETPFGNATQTEERLTAFDQNVQTGVNNSRPKAHAMR